MSDMWLFETARDWVSTHLPRQRGASAHTVKGYRESLNLLLRYAASRAGKALGDLAAEDLGGQCVSGFADWLADERGCGPRTVNNRLAGVRAFLKYCGWRDPSRNALYLEARSVPNRKVPRRSVVDHFDEEARDAILAQPDRATRAGRRDLFLMVLLYDTGCRVGEVLRMRPGDFSRSRAGTSVTVRGKGDKVRVVPVTDDASAHLERYLAEFHDDGVPEGTPLFYTRVRGSLGPMSDDNAERIVRKHARAARESCPSVPERVVPHMFRHSRALHLYHAGVPLPLIGEWLGHQDLGTTLIYAYSDADMMRDEIEAATKGGHPLAAAALGDESTGLSEDELLRLYGLA